MVTETEIRALAIQRTRRHLLATLKDWYPVAPSFFDVRLTMPGVELSVLKKDISYLMEPDKGYVECTNERPNMSWDDRCFKLTGKGVEVADRLRHDEALGT